MLKIKKICLALSVIASVWLLSGCGSKVTQENFNKIQVGMSQSETYAILGQPSDATSVGIGEHSGTLATWQAGENEVTITFINDKVKFKAFTQVPQQKPQPKTQTN